MTGLSITDLPQRAVIEVAGAEARDFLQGLLSNDVGRLADGALYAALLTPQGKFLYDMLLAADGERLFLDCAAAHADELLRRLTMYRLRAKVTLARRDDLAVLALFPADGEGPETAPAGRDGEALRYRDPRLPDLGWRAIVPADRRDLLGAIDAKPEDYDRFRLALGVPDGERDIESGRGLLLESNFEELHGVDFHKGCFVGQELTARTKHRALVKKRLWGIRHAGGPDLPPAGTPIVLDGQDAGQMASSRDGWGLALLRLDKLRASLDQGGRLTAGEAVLQPVQPPYLPQSVLQPGDAGSGSGSDSGGR